MLIPEVLTSMDINERFLSMVSLEKSGKNINMTSADILPHPDGGVRFSGTNYSEAMGSLSSSIRTMFKRSRFKSKSCITYIPSDESVVKVVTKEISDLRDDSIEQFIIMNSSHYIPYNIDAVNFDFVKIGSADSRQKVLLVACKKDLIEDLSACVEEGGMTLKYVELTQFALLRLLKNSLPDRYASGNIKFMLYIDYDITSSYAFDGDEPIYNKEHRFGYSRLHSMMSTKYDISMDSAEKMETYGGLPDDFNSVFNSFVEGMSVECFRSYDFFHSNMTDLDKPVDVFIFGHGAKLTGLDDILSRRIKDAEGVYLVDPMRNIQIGRNVSQDFISNNRYALSRSIAMALRGLV